MSFKAINYVLGQTAHDNNITKVPFTDDLCSHFKQCDMCTTRMQYFWAVGGLNATLSLFATFFENLQTLANSFCL